ncbi:hypothetical protein [Ponticaulis sp.]|uniref:hypothetical protein n=1 Tax=Ponticaulis sp. TaxID=2020902 RepID=UPI000B63B482|nr:hypothetical protein [Ponticaulis sp.]MAI91181.1 hypothetical protein [Ponticaulis sp.]OUX98495.1 MAG: hypothetical protein CBB65_12100 [Hyphomonadaceae bacterium TMED5]|tara:strand:- start:111913 stop:112758 length:846 start_codon:yes stop_codon:yes gene_type:complete
MKSVFTTFILAASLVWGAAAQSDAAPETVSAESSNAWNVPAPPNVFLRAVDGEGELLEVGRAVSWDIITLNGEAVPDANGEGFEHELRLSPGSYIVTAFHGDHVSISATISVTEGRDIHRDIAFSDGTVRFTPILVSGGEVASGIFNWEVLSVSASGVETVRGRDNGQRARFTLLPGEYRIRLTGQAINFTAPFVVQADDVREDLLVLDAAWLHLSGPEGTEYSLSRTNSEGEMEVVASAERAATRFLVLAGEYELEVRRPDGTETRQVTLAPGQERELSF